MLLPLRQSRPAITTTCNNLRLHPLLKGKAVPANSQTWKDDRSRRGKEELVVCLFCTI
jgi:hypothetical protein